MHGLQKSSMMFTTEQFTLVGQAICGLFALKVTILLYKFFLRPSKNLKKLGDWAVVTGATDGIGKAYAFQLASKGINVVLISRTKSKLQDVAREITSKFPSVSTKVIVVDFSDFSSTSRQAVSDVCSDLDIGILVNNVGVSYPYPKYFTELTSNEVFGLMEMNVASTTFMTHIVLPGMMDRKRGAGELAKRAASEAS